MDLPPACYFASVQDGKQEIYLEWPILNIGNQFEFSVSMHVQMSTANVTAFWLYLHNAKQAFSINACKLN